MIASDVEMLRLHYAYTLRHWLDRATKKRAKIEKLYDARFFRMWEFYLAGGIVMFESGAACNYQVQYVRDRRATPITRDYMFEAEKRYREAGRKAGAGEETRGAGRKKVGSRGLTLAALDPHHAHVAMLVGRDPAVMVGIGAVEMGQRRGLRFGQRDAAIVIGIGHVEHLPAEAHAAHVHHPHLHATLAWHGGIAPGVIGPLPSRMTMTRCSRTCEWSAMNSWRLILPSRLVSSWSKIAPRSPI